ncbi:MAG: lysine--tRNA ligase [Rhizobiales bacterium]|nr:lysine--tRNA ligase [Hyphomicrobiales bacterium]
MPADPALRAAALESKAWPFEEARKLLDRIKRKKSAPREILFETGYGPSGLPHIGTFGEVARTTMVRHAFETMSDVPTRLLCFSDDMDGLRKVPDNIPNKEMVREHLGRQLTKIPDPFGEYESFGHHNNAMLRRFLDHYGFDYEFASSTEYYAAGRFDAALLLVLERYDEIMAIMLPSLREERSQTYSPFLPVHPRTGVVMQVPVIERKLDAGTIVWRDPDTAKQYETPVTGGHCKLQWKPDWGMRWHALGVDYEMAGKDLIDSVKLSSKICAALGSEPPEGFNYELFLDERGQKISKSKGNGLTIDEWLAYADPQSLQLFMYNRPREAKKLYFDVIPRAVDEYQSFLDAYPRQDVRQQLTNPVWHIHSGRPPQPEVLVADASGRSQAVSFALLLNLAAVANAETKDVLWAFLRRYAPHVSPETHPRLDALVGYAIRYFHDFVKPNKKYRLPTEEERQALAELDEALARLPSDASAEVIQQTIYDVGRRDPYKTVQKDGSTGVSLAWFNTLYQILLGEEKGPRFGSFVALYGLDNTHTLIAKALAGELVKGE